MRPKPLAISLVWLGTVANASLVCAQTVPPADTGRSAPVGHRQPTSESVNAAKANRGTAQQSQPRGRDLGSELSICRGC
jgi:hypothetical protein